MSVQSSAVSNRVVSSVLLKMTYKKVTHVLFDMDGLILNTEELYTIAIDTIASRYGKRYTYEIKYPLMGSQSHELADGTIRALNLPMSREEFMNDLKILGEKLFPDCLIMPGARKLIEHLHENKIQIGLATSASKYSYNLKTQKHQQLFSLFPYKTWGSSDPAVKEGKPSPDIFLVAADKFPDKPKPEQCLVFEDAVNGVTAARSAGMQVVMIPDPKLPRHRTTHATIVLDSLEHFQPDMFGLPLYKQ